MSSKIKAVVVTFNPDIELLEKNIRAVYRFAGEVIIVDSGSKNLKEIVHLCESAGPKVVSKPLGANLGIGKALNEGVRAAGEFDWLLTLDQDGVVLCDVASIMRQAKNFNKLGAISLSYTKKRGSRKFAKVKYAGNSGLIINADAFGRGARYREDFFMDQIDYDFCWQLRRMGYEIIATTERCIDQRAGELKNGKKGMLEPTWRQYLISRNSTVLVLERKLDISMYILQYVNVFLSTALRRTSRTGRSALALLKGFFCGFRGKGIDVGFMTRMAYAENKDFGKICFVLQKQKGSLDKDQGISKTLTPQ